MAIVTRNFLEGISPLPEGKGNEKKQRVTKLLTDLKYAQRSSRYLFRGLSNRDYELVPSIGRQRNREPFDIKDEKILFRIIKTEGMMFIERGDLSDIDLLALSQHFGAPTRLLDWTSNPLVALYFSIFSSEPIDNTNDGIVYVYRSKTDDYIRETVHLNSTDNDASLFSEKILHGGVKFIFPKFADARIKNQSGLFSIQSDPQASFAANCDKGRLWYVIVPKDIKVTLARYLYGLGITRDFIMPGFEGFCRTLNYRYRYNVGVLSSQLERKLEEQGKPDAGEDDDEVN
jgi:FRG domain